MPHTESVYEWFHQHPELSLAERRTSERMAKELRSLGMDVHENIGGFGVVGILRGRKQGHGPVVLYRADMDALPVTERTGLPYTSENPGVMHACGHDIHMATALGTLAVLRALTHQWSGTVLFVAQPAEERGSGAFEILTDPRFLKLVARVGNPSLALAVHTSDGIPAGKVGLLGGYVGAAIEAVDITIYGKGGHGARPHQTIDPIVIGAETVLALQTVVSRRISPLQRAVVTVGSFQGGNKRNVIPPSVHLALTVRFYEDAVRTKLLEEINRTALHVARAHGAVQPPDVRVVKASLPAVYNDPAWTERLRALYQETLGADRVVLTEPSMGGEDFARFTRRLKCPSVLVRLGATDPRALSESDHMDRPGLHSDRFAPIIQPTLNTGVVAMSATILDALDAWQAAGD
jgi:hippurate hydrolase